MNLRVNVSYFESGDKATITSEQEFRSSNMHQNVHDAASFIRGFINDARNLTSEDTRHTWVDLSEIAKVADDLANTARYVEWFTFNDGFQSIVAEITAI